MSKKDFTNNNPALNFINVNQPDISSNDSSSNSKATNSSISGYPESKSRRFQLLIQPSVFNHLKKYAQDHYLSVNETINQAIKQFLNDND